MAKYTLSQKWLTPFIDQSIDVGALHTSQVIIRPRQVIDSNTNEYSFEFPTTGNHLIDLKSVYLHVKGKLKNGEGKDLVATDNVALCNYGLTSLFSKMVITIGNSQTKIHIDDLPYIYHRNILDCEKKNSTAFDNIGYFPDYGIQTKDGTKFVQYEDKKKLYEKSSQVSFMGKIHCGFF